MIVCIIPARGGSKRIPRKNIKNFCNVPIIAHSIKSAISSGIFSHVVVSTDDDEIKSVAEKYGAKVPFIRPDNLSDDMANTFDVMSHGAKWVLESIPSTQYLCCLYATSPFVRPEDLIGGLELLKNTEADYVYSVTEFEFPIQRAIKVIKGKAIPFNKEYMLSRSQDLEASYHDAGQFYFGKVSSFADKVDFFSDNSFVYNLPRERVQDIDSPDDWRYAELMYQLLLERDK